MNFLQRLLGRKEEPVELPPEFLQENPPDWLIDFKGRLPAPGGPFSIRVQINTSTRTANADLTLLPGSAGGEPKNVSAALERAELDRLLVILEFSFPADIADATSDAPEDTTASVSIHHRQPYDLRSGVFQLSDWLDSRKPGPPVIEIARILIEVQRRMLPFPASP